MKVRGKGALPSQMIRLMMSGGYIEGADTQNIRPASLDLSLSEEVYRAVGVFQPRPGKVVRDLLDDVEARPHDFAHPLERGVAYLARLNEILALPESVYAYCNPKSSSGRNDVDVCVLADGVPRYDAATPSGFNGELWLAIQPQSFPIQLTAGETLSQIRFFNADTRFTETDLELHLDQFSLLWWGSGGKPIEYREIQINDRDGSVILTLDLSGDVPAWECLGHNRILDFSRRDCQPEDFFRKLERRKNTIQLKRGGFYVFYTKERVRVPPFLACEMVPIDLRSGEFRSHYAGYIDPGWGWGSNGDGCGRRLVLEVRPLKDLVLRDNQSIAKIRFERMIEEPEFHYDEAKSSNYRRETAVPRLSKHFYQE